MNNVHPINVPNISIIICCYNGEKTIMECLISLSNMKTSSIAIEIILINDGSKDKTSIIIQSFLNNNKLDNPRFRFINKKNEGLSAARNLGISISSSDIIAFVDQDAIVQMDFAIQVYHCFKNNIHINCVGGDVGLLNVTPFSKMIHDSIFSYYMKSPSSVIGTNMAFRKDFLDDINGFDNYFTYRGDESALFAKAGHKLKILKCPSIKVLHNQPNNYREFFKTKIENGFFSAKIDQRYHTFKHNLMKLLNRFFLIAIPFILIPINIFYDNPIIAGLVMMLWVMLFIRRFIISRAVHNIISIYLKNSLHYKNTKILLYISSLFILGEFISDFHYIKGYMFINK